MMSTGTGLHLHIQFSFFLLLRLFLRYFTVTYITLTEKTLVYDRFLKPTKMILKQHKHQLTLPE